MQQRRCCLTSTSFNPRAHAGRDARSMFNAGPRDRVSIHAPTRGATPGGNTDNAGADVSIHAPTRGATGAGFAGDARDRVSIHAPTRGATIGASSVMYHLGCFNPRAHAGRDSTTPTRPTSCSARFNPRAHAGRDSAPRWQPAVPSAFQSTRPRGARRHALRFETVVPDDVSIHAPTRGATRAAPCSVLTGVVSIHAPTRGATALAGAARALTHVSIHAPTRGATPESADRVPAWKCFNPRAHAGRDWSYPAPRPSVLAFQSTRPRGARRFWGDPINNMDVFQSTRPRGARPP